MPRLSLTLVAAAALALAGCATPQPAVETQEQLLSAAGFDLQPATTTAQWDTLASLPPRELVWQQRNGKLTFLYADPLGCKCLFVGSEQAYQRFRELEAQAWITQQNLMAAQANASASWTPWGGPPIWAWQ